MKSSLYPVDAETLNRNDKPQDQNDLSYVQPDPTKIAVLINQNARKTSEKLVKKITRIVGSEHIYNSYSLDAAEKMCREIVQEGYGTIVTAGGDGTLCQAINFIFQYIQEANRWRTKRYLSSAEPQDLIGLPRFAFLKLGTGNGIGSTVGAGHPLEDLKTIVDFAPARTFEIPLIQCDNERFFFGGLGYDSSLLNDYNWLKSRTQHPLLKMIFGTVMGYFTAAFTRTIPNNLFHDAGLAARIVTRTPAYFVDPRRGDIISEIPAGTVLHEGSARLICVGTIPFLGKQLKVFPFAGLMPNKMHLRIGMLNPLSTVAHLPSLWRGSYRNPEKVFDFLVDDIQVELNKPFAFQHSGDDKGLHQHLNFRLSDESLKLVDYLPPKILC